MSTPDAFAALALLATLLGEWLLPLPILPPASLTSPITWLGILLAILGFTLELSAARALASARTPTRPNATPTALVTTGPFRWTRSPFYIGILLLLAGLSLALSLDWSLLTLPLFAVALDRLIISTEEQRLSAAFPEAWQTYSATTPAG